MSFGKIFSLPGSFRSSPLLTLAEKLGLDVQLVPTIPHGDMPEEFKLNFPLQRIPAFLGSNGFALSESVAIAYYLAQQKSDSGLMGEGIEEQAKVMQWVLFSASDIPTALAAQVYPQLGFMPYNKMENEKSVRLMNVFLSAMEEHLTSATYLVGDGLSYADISCAASVGMGAKFCYVPEVRAKYPNVFRWLKTIWAQAELEKHMGKLDYPSELPPIPGAAKKEKKKQAPTEQKPKQEPREKSKPKAKADEDEEMDDAPKEPAPKHPLELANPGKLKMDDWKREYSNASDSKQLFESFWKQFEENKDYYSIWKVTYSYPDELSSMSFMNSNLITGLHTRLEASRKFLFGCLSVYHDPADSKKHQIVGSYFGRGLEWEPLFDCAPDHESYKFERLNSENDADRKFLEKTWDDHETINIDGKDWVYVDGKVFK